MVYKTCVYKCLNVYAIVPPNKTQTPLPKIKNILNQRKIRFNDIFFSFSLFCPFYFSSLAFFHLSKIPFPPSNPKHNLSN